MNTGLDILLELACGKKYTVKNTNVIVNLDKRTLKDNEVPYSKFKGIALEDEVHEVTYTAKPEKDHENTITNFEEEAKKDEDVIKVSEELQEALNTLDEEHACVLEETSFIDLKNGSKTPLLKPKNKEEENLYSDNNINNKSIKVENEREKILEKASKFLTKELNYESEVEIEFKRNITELNNSISSFDVESIEQEMLAKRIRVNGQRLKESIFDFSYVSDEDRIILDTDEDLLELDSNVEDTKSNKPKKDKKRFKLPWKR